MKRFIIFGFLFSLLVSCSLFDTDPELTGHPLKARIMGDMQYRNFKVSNSTSFSGYFKKDDDVWLCRHDEEEMETIVIIEEEAGRPERRMEYAYYCPEEHIYWYHVLQGKGHRNLLFGPFLLQY